MDARQEPTDRANGGGADFDFGHQQAGIGLLWQWLAPHT
jgi:hypothetical protein